MYLMMPLHMHIDYGFGATAEQFKESADILSASESVKDLGMPVNYLRRHAIELYLKSLIYVLHRKFKIPFSSGGTLEKPKIKVLGKDYELENMHDIRLLTMYLMDQHNKLIPCFFHLGIGVIEKDILHKINKINSIDSKSTFFRYPKTGDHIQDMRKSSVRQKSTEDIINSMNKKEGKYVKALLLVDDEDNIVDSFDIDVDVFPDLNKNLIYLCDYFHDLHAAYRWGICDGR
ncbi:hypothetical protein [Salmonella enterica]|uniref:Uncharacterized protein n=7 Tax=Salmonella enterica TaxID=28901 RepID=A0A735RLK8_SALDZ|nr:hypothetical protein [Salmonella enterica]ECG1721494.1 hypothetical protein [Salmonella enterica subsp. diarizonae serovar 17:z10:e,n,x,z15]EDN2302409.1 hypothetical protein [Salmonella enterica subsp. diarizonae serovar 65:(k):z]EDS4947771.1 hypothetical protein [Salmonella enterica subsp. enterica serovar Redlands]EDU0823308.1 hypothetical protein [Salmonella enterica subsp. diarizonae serovar 50:k:z]EDX2472795.1 hypothetical protein [Salmonella enterica subsp. diarizonae serovar 16:z10:e